jgi:hypothetical protein
MGQYVGTSDRWVWRSLKAVRMTAGNAQNLNSILRPNVPRVLALFRHSGSMSMKKFLVLCVAIGVGLSAPAAFARGGGMGSHHSASASTVGSGGAFGERVGAPGTNSLGTALSSSGFGSGPQKGPLLGTNPATDREEAKVNKMISSICRGC